MSFKLNNTEEIWKCSQCGFCTASCPAVERTGWESYGPRGKMYLLKLLLKDKISLSRDFIDRFYSCTTCGRCSEVCQNNLGLVEIWEEFRSVLVKENLGPINIHKILATAIAESNNPYRESAANRSRWLDGIKLPTRGDVLYFAGCTAAIMLPSLARTGLKILQSTGQKITVLGEDEWCCGSVLLRTGQGNQVKKLADHNLEALQSTGAKLVVTSCTGCFKTISTDYPRLYGRNLPFEVMHITQYIKEQIDQGGLKLTKPLQAKVTYHDPCHLGRHMGEYDAPRSILKAIPGVELIEMENIRENAKCCGGGGGVKLAYPNLAQSMGKARVEEAAATGATILASCCPLCNFGLSEAISSGNTQLVEKDITELVLNALET